MADPDPTIAEAAKRYWHDDGSSPGGVVETNFPHPTSIYPNVQEQIVKSLAGFGYAIRKQVLQDNPTMLYNLPIRWPAGRRCRRALSALPSSCLSKAGIAGP